MTDDSTKHVPTGDYDVGYCRPPKQHRWKKGQSGRGSGKPGKARSSATKDMDQLLRAEMNKVVELTEGGKRVKLTYMEVFAKRMIHHAVHGTPAQALRIFQQLRALGILSPRPEDFEPAPEAVRKLVERLAEEARREEEADAAAGRR